MKKYRVGVAGWWVRMSHAWAGMVAGVMAVSPVEAQVTTNQFQEGQYPDSSYNMMDLTIQNGAGTLAELYAGRVTTVPARGMVSFDLSAIASAKTVSDASLRVYVSGYSVNLPVMNLYRVRHTDGNGNVVPFDANATWTKATASESWTTAGGDAPWVVGSVTHSNAAGYYTFTNKALAVAILDAVKRGEALQLQIRANDEGRNYERFTFANESDGDLNKRPLLTVQWSTTVPPADPEGTIRFQEGQYPNALYDTLDRSIYQANSGSDNLGAGMLNGSLVIRSLISYDLSAIPAGSKIHSASLRLNVNASQYWGGGDRGVYLRLYAVNATNASGDAVYFDASATWSNVNATAQWNTPGGDVGTLLESVKFTNSPAVLGYYTLTGGTLTNAVKAAVDSGRKLQLQIRSSVENMNNEKVYFSDESDPNVDLRPLLSINYTPRTGTVVSIR